MIRRIAVALALLAGLAGIVVAGGVLGFWLYSRLIFGFTITDQPALLKLPPTFNADVEATNTVTIKLDGLIDATVPFKQTLNLPVTGDYDADISLDTIVPISFTIVYKGLIPVDTFASIRGTTDFLYQNVKRLRNVPFSARVPLKFEQPVSFTVPVNSKLHLIYKGPLHMNLDQTIAAPVDTVLHTRIKAVREITTPILTHFGLRVHVPDETLTPVILKHSDLRMRLDTLRLARTPDPSVPQRAPVAPGEASP